MHDISEIEHGFRRQILVIGTSSSVFSSFSYWRLRSQAILYSMSLNIVSFCQGATPRKQIKLDRSSEHSKCYINAIQPKCLRTAIHVTEYVNSAVPLPIHFTKETCQNLNPVLSNTRLLISVSPSGRVPRYCININHYRPYSIPFSSIFLFAI
jgi:hypothetical protein